MDGLDGSARPADDEAGAGDGDDTVGEPPVAPGDMPPDGLLEGLPIPALEGGEKKRGDGIDTAPSNERAETGAAPGDDGDDGLDGRNERPPGFDGLGMARWLSFGPWAAAPPLPKLPVEPVERPGEFDEPVGEKTRRELSPAWRLAPSGPPIPGV